MGDLRDAFDVSVKANKELVGKLDDAVVAAGRKIADQVDDAVENGEGQEVTKALYLVPHLMGILRELYATPKARREAGIGKEEARGKLAAIRDIRNRPAPSKKRGTESA